MGKIILDFSTPSALPTTIKRQIFCPSTLYILSGGLGALGWASVKWMAEEGARKFLLLSRSANLSIDQKEELEELKKEYKSALHVELGKCDVANGSEFEQIIANATKSGLLSSPKPRLAILHLAMALHDAPIHAMTETQLQGALACKVAGARNLVEPFLNEG